MKKVTISICAIVIALNLNSQNVKTFNHIKNGNRIEITVSTIDSITFDEFLVLTGTTGVLINGVVWATCNVSTPNKFASYPYEAGMFYQWNRKVGWSCTDPMVNSDGGTTWTSAIFIGDNWEDGKGPCPPGWRLPTSGELQSLLSSHSLWHEWSGVSGRFFGSDSQKVFFPAVGERNGDNGKLYGVGYCGYYWSGTPIEQSKAYFLSLQDNNYSNISYERYNYGYSVRCVLE